MLITKNCADEKRTLYELKKTHQSYKLKIGAKRSREEAHRRQNRLRGDQRRINDYGWYSQSRKRISRSGDGSPRSRRLGSSPSRCNFLLRDTPPSPWRNFPREARQCDGTRRREKYQGSCFPSGNSISNEIKPRFHRGVNATSRISLWGKRGRKQGRVTVCWKMHAAARTTERRGLPPTTQMWTKRGETRNGRQTARDRRQEWNRSFYE